MAQYFNRESGALAITLRTGKACSIPGKSWVEIAPEDEGSEDLIRVLQKGFVYRFDADAEEQKALAAKTPAVVEVKTAPEPVAEVPVSPAPTAVEAAPLSKGEEVQDPPSEKISELQRRKKG